MIKKAVILGLIILLILGLTGCDKKEETTETTIENPFIGGVNGLEANFENLRADVRDQGQDPFDIILKLENNGEQNIEVNKVKVTLSGINPTEFSITQSDLTKRTTEESISRKKTTEGDITPSAPAFIEYTGINYKGKITGTQMIFPLKADICYNYKTNAVGKLCVRSNALTSEEGVCTVTGEKTIYSSGSPVQIANLKENARAKNKVGFTFEIINAGDGSLYKTGENCDQSKRENENKVHVKVESNLAGLNCVGLTNTGTGITEGYVTMYAGTKIISCSQETPVNDFEQVIKITAEYDYEISKTESIIVKSSEIV